MTIEYKTYQRIREREKDFTREQKRESRQARRIARASLGLGCIADPFRPTHIFRFYVYALSDPGSGCIKWVGLTHQPLEVTLSSILGCERHYASKLGKWLKILTDLKQQPKISLLGISSKCWYCAVQAREILIAAEIQNGNQLLNRANPFQHMPKGFDTKSLCPSHVELQRNLEKKIASKKGTVFVHPEWRVLALLDPFPRQVMWISAEYCGVNRFLERHLDTSRTYTPGKLNKWIEDIVARGLVPEAKVVEVVGTCWYCAVIEEAKWIDFCLARRHHVLSAKRSEIFLPPFKIADEACCEKHRERNSAHNVLKYRSVGDNT